MHTAGTWYVSPAGSIILAHGDDGTDRIVCHLSLTRSQGEVFANGALIESAPVMLAALEAADRHLVHLGQCGLCRGGFARICKVAVDAGIAVTEALKQARQGQGGGTVKRIGFTGTRQSITQGQMTALRRLLIAEGEGGAEVHHGDCVGADTACHVIAVSLTYRTVVHPPADSFYRGFCPGTEVLQEKPYLDRNKDIVDACDLLIACPQGPEEQRSGTWSTIRYARRQGKPVVIVWPSGEVTREEVTP